MCGDVFTFLKPFEDEGAGFVEGEYLYDGT